MRVRATLSTATVILLPILAVLTLHGLGDQPWLRVDWTDLGGWLARAPLEDALAALLRYAGLAAGYYLAGSTLLYLMALASGTGRLIRITGLMTLPVVRRMADRVVAGTTMAAVLTAPLVGWAVDQTPTSSPVPIAVDYLPDAYLTDPYVPDPYRTPYPAAPYSAPYPAAPSTTSTVPAAVPEIASIPTVPGFEESNAIGESTELSARGTVEVVVRSGDHLWSLAAARLAGLLGRPAADHEVGPYWVQVVESNRGRIRSGDPDLIFPGEVILLPAVGG